MAAAPTLRDGPALHRVRTPVEGAACASHLRGYPGLALITYETGVLKTGIDLLATLGDVKAAIITVSPDRRAGRLMDEAGINLIEGALYRCNSIPLYSA